jgi:hypothetical protein
MNHEKILILDFGSQVTQLIARRVREARRLLRDPSVRRPGEFIRDFAPKGVILSGSHMSAYEESTDRAPGGVRARRAGARHLLRHADDGAAARRPRRGRATSRVRLRRGAGARPHRLLGGIEDRATPKATAC